MGLFACQTQIARKRRIIFRRKNPSGMVVNYYRYAYDAIVGCVSSEGFVWEKVLKTYERIKKADFPGPFWPKVRNANISVVRKFLAIAEKASPPQGEQICRNRQHYLDWNGVQISILPDIVTLCRSEGTFSFTKLRLAREKYTWDASEYVLLLLERFAHSIEKDLGLQFDMSKCKLIDCADQIVFEGHKVNARKRISLENSLEEYKTIWPSVKTEKRSK
jgi:hypothetical protein